MSNSRNKEQKKKENTHIEDIPQQPFNLNNTQKTALNAIFNAGELPRARLAEICGVSAPAITRIARELISRDLIMVSGRGSNTRGQPSTNLAINPNGALSIGLFIERDALSFNLINFVGDVIKESRLSGEYSHQESIPQICKHLDKFIKSNIPDREKVVGMGIAVTGNFVIDGRSVTPPEDMENWSDVDFANVFGRKYPYPIIVENDGSAAALGELLTGQGQDYKTFFYVHMGNGLGGGYILNGELIRGAHGNASEFGHFLHPPKIRPTLKNLAENLKRPLGDVNHEEIESMFNNNDSAFFNWLDKAIENLHHPINSTAILMDPEAIVLGGRFPTVVIDYMLSKLVLYDYGEYWQSVPRPVLVAAKNFSTDAVVYGAAALPLYKVLLSN